MRVNSHIRFDGGRFMILLPRDQAKLCAQAWEITLEQLRDRAVTFELEV